MKSFTTPEYSGVWFTYFGERLALREQIQNYLKETLNDSDGRIDHRDDGPHWISSILNDAVELSYAHTEGVAILVYSKTHRLGVDVEAASRMIPNAISLAERFFHQDEIAKLKRFAISDQNIEFLKIWTQIEAIAKLTRLGLGKTIRLKPLSASLATPRVLPLVPIGFIASIAIA